jgi:hypothetical protein
MLGGDRFMFRRVGAGNWTAAQKEFYASVFAERSIICEDPHITGHPVMFQVHDANESAAGVVIGVESIASVAVMILGGINPASDKQVADGLRRRVFGEGGDAGHEVIRIEPPACYSIIKDLDDERVTEEVLTGLMLHVWRVAVEFFSRRGLC